MTALYMTGNQSAPDCVSDLIVIDRADGQAPIDKHVPRLQTPPIVAVRKDLVGDDPLRRQLAVAAFAESATADELQTMAADSDEAVRLAATLIAGRMLTVPSPHFTPPRDLELFYPKGNSFFHRVQQFYGDEREIDLADLGRVGSFTTAQLWAHGRRTDEQEALFAGLIELLGDPSDRVRLQAAYFLSLLKDSRSERLVEQTRRDVQLRRLQVAKQVGIERAWIVGPLASEELTAAAQELEQGRVDLSSSYEGRVWQERRLADVSLGEGDTGYAYVRLVSGARQDALIVLDRAGTCRVWQNETTIAETSPGGSQAAYIVDLQPGSNDLLLRSSSLGELNLGVRAASRIEVMLPEKLDSSLLAERLRSSSVGEVGQPVPAEFAAVDWTAAARDGDAAEGRRLFGTLGCAKCHAVVPDQKSAGAPSLFEAKRRFAVPHLVESVLLPSRQVAEPFRAQTFVTVDGRTLTGLVTGETAEAVELLLPDAKRRTLYKKQVEDRVATQLSPMPQGLVKSPVELRDLLAYLLSDAPLPP